MSARRTTIEGKTCHVFQKVPRKSDDDRFPVLEKRLFGKPFLFVVFVVFVGLSAIGGLVDD